MAPPVFVFDAYGTLFNVHAAIAKHRDACGPQADRLSELWRIKQLEYTWTLTLAGQYVDFWTLTERALDFAFSRVPSADRKMRPKLLEAYSTLGAFADAKPALQMLKQRKYRTAILSNGTPKMLRSAINAAEIGSLIDAVLSAESISMYKPRPEVYRLATVHFKCSPREVMFVSSNRWDIMGAMAYKFRGVWINRSRAPQEYGNVADETLTELSQLADLARG
jgi:2-haloacid dehalogenase